MTQLFDKRETFFRGAFASARSYGDYVATGTVAEQARWKGYEDRLTLSDQDKKVLATFTRKMHVLVLSGLWCGDCARQCPMFSLIASYARVLDLRYLDNQINPELRDELRIHGAARVPVIVTLSEDFYEINRCGDRTLSAYRRKAANELGPACDAGLVPPPADELSLEVSEWVSHFERLHTLLRVSPFLRARHND